MKKHFVILISAVLLLLTFEMSAAAQNRNITLNEAQNMALRNNPNLRNVGEVMYQADLLIYKAWAILLPNLSMDGSITRNNSETKMSIPDFENIDPDTGEMPMNEIIMQDLWGEKFGFTANMTLFNARSIPLLKNAYDNQDGANFNGRHQKNDLLFAVAGAYYQVSSTKKMIEVAEDNLENAHEFLKLSQTRKTVGQATKIDVLRAETEVMNYEKELKNANDSLQLAKTGLSYLIGIKGEYDISEPEAVVPLDDSLESLKQKALKDRLDLKVANLQKIMAERYRTEVWTQWIPVFDVTYNWSWASEEGFSGKNDSWRLIFGANWSLFDGGYRVADLFEKSSQMRIAKNQADQLSLDIREEVEKGKLAVLQQERNVEIAQKQLELAEETHNLVKRQYELGMASSLDVLDASTRLSNAKSGLILEQLRYDIDALQLNKSVGVYNPLAMD